jgi:threonine/homoserine/homoserine lactone efflux protein
MNLQSTLAFTAAFFLLALVPGPGLAMILSRTLGSGMAAGFAVTTGLILGDFVFMGLAIAGLSAIATTMGPLFQTVKYAGAAYLVWLGVRTLMAKPAPIVLRAQPVASLWREVAMGFFVTMGNPKPILFYGALMPLFIDMASVGAQDLIAFAGVVIVVSYLVYGAYMVLVERARHVLASSKAHQRLNQVTGSLFVGSGIWVATR